MHDIQAEGKCMACTKENDSVLEWYGTSGIADGKPWFPCNYAIRFNSLTCLTFDFLHSDSLQLGGLEQCG